MLYFTKAVTEPEKHTKNMRVRIHFSGKKSGIQPVFEFGLKTAEGIEQ